jgi:NhaA family Na+:H+ antiporter
MIFRPIRNFLRIEAASGILLIATLLIVLILANTPLFPMYQHILAFPIQIRIGSLDLHKPLELWVNDGLMALFFMLLALEIKREILEGELSSLPRIILPLIAATGGIVVPIVIYFLIIGSHEAYRPGWAIPTTTDIALVLGFMALLGKRIPVNLKLFLVALSIVDDIVAIALIAIFYSDNIALLPLLLGLLGIAVLAIMGLKRIGNKGLYLFIGTLVWIAILKSGVHATLAGIAVGFCVPLTSRDPNEPSPLKTLEHGLHPWVAYFIMPFFVFINAGIPFHAVENISLFSAMPMGIALGLFLGKQIGVFCFTFIAVKLKLTKLPHGINWWQIYGIAVLSGIGFTMSLFISSMAFDISSLEIVCRQGIIVGSFLSALVGTAVLYFATNKPLSKSSPVPILEKK